MAMERVFGALAALPGSHDRIRPPTVVRSASAHAETACSGRQGSDDKSRRVRSLAAIVRGTALAMAIAAAFATCARAGEADVIDAKVRRNSSGTLDFDVTVKSVDKGARYYADAIEVLAPDGKRLGRRELWHSHEDEQPFTRDVYGVRIPPGVEVVHIRAHHSVKGYDGRTLTLKLPKPPTR